MHHRHHHKQNKLNGKGKEKYFQFLSQVSLSVTLQPISTITGFCNRCVFFLLALLTKKKKTPLNGTFSLIELIRSSDRFYHQRGID